ncbi:peptide ABC transporter substrate-binding protein [Pediococcus argentinicus]|uniref:OppA protein n=1 Tax=Pediococcus argentinicus TaxID=480391 RepID=A0A0R2NJB8_9LACO|nr:peptide ABC transporter substrate-binding protein [Pediococcus argentinicus]KRO25861.1 oppA protein [Pediococcus argentinicus]NKZ21854.1 peptide ABC transporter substrate-binding protein [Pediococcus argentinicus]GEP19024.1 peptide ABC transporter substrate-binding protein [Pediococcus argentinicus]
MKFKTVGKLGAVALASTFILAACGSNNSAKKNSVNFRESAEIATMDQSKVTDVVGLTQLGNTEEGLYRIGKDNKIENALATDTKVSDGGKEYTFNIRKGAKWSNGETVTAKDFVFGWQRTVNPKTASQYAYLFSGIKNADKIAANKANYKTLGVKADGDNKLVVTLDRPVPYFKLLMGFPIFFPQNEKAVDKYGSSYGTTSAKTVYNGPFKQEGWKGSNLSWKLVKNPDFWNKSSVKTDTINYQVVKDAGTALNMYNSKKLDQNTLTGDQVKQYKNDKNFVKYLNSSTFYLEFNEKKDKYFKNQKIRQALSLAINRDQFTKKVLADGSEPATGLTSAGLAKDPKTGTDFAKEVNVPEASKYDLAQAKKLMAEGLKEEGMKSLNFQLMSDDTTGAKQSTEYIQSAWEKIPNVKVSLSNIPFKNRLANSQNGKFDAVITAWGADFSDPISFLQLFTTGNSLNNGKWKSAEFDQLIKDAGDKDANNPEKRWNDMLKAERILLKEQAISPLYQQAQSMLRNQNIKGIVYNSAGLNFDYSHMTVK